jgi:hypothetical protein
MSEVENINLLSIDVKKTKILGIDNLKLIDEIRSSDGVIEEHFFRNKNHTYYEDQRYPFGKPESEKLINVLTEKVSQLTGREMILSEIWTLTLKDGQSVAAHSHKSNTYLNQKDYFSIAYYPSAPTGSAELIFMVDACNTLEQSISITPETGDLVMFNSYLMHMTNRHQNQFEERVVISANFWPKNPDETPSQDWSAYSRIDYVDETKKLKEYSFACLANVETPWGQEGYTIGVLEDEQCVEIFNEKGYFKASDYFLGDNKFKCSFMTNIPIDASISIDLDIDNQRKTANGVLQINQYPGYKIAGVFL